MGTRSSRNADGGRSSGRHAEPAFGTTQPLFSLTLDDLKADRDERNRLGAIAAVDIARRAHDQRVDDRRRFEARNLTDADRNAMLSKVKAAFENDQREVMLCSFPSEFCTDGGRKINNRFPDWLDTLPAGAKVFVKFWRDALQPGGFGLGARILAFPGGIPGDVGLFVTWPQSRG